MGEKRTARIPRLKYGLHRGKSLDEILLITNTSDMIVAIISFIDCRSEARYRKMPELCRNVCSVYPFVLEYLNGGSHQYLFNSAGDHVEDVIRFAKQTNDEPLLMALNRLSAFFAGSSIPLEREERQAALRDCENLPGYDWFRGIDKNYRGHEYTTLELLRDQIMMKASDLKAYFRRREYSRSR